MRKLLVAFLVLAMVVGVAADSKPEITVRDVNPEPANPGDTVEVFLTVENAGTTAETYEPVKVETPRGITYLGTSDFDESIQLCGGCQRVGKLNLKTRESLNSGTYPVSFKLTSSGSGAVKKYGLTVDGEPELSVNAVNSSAVPGETSEMTLEIENIGTDNASQVKVEASSQRIGFEPSSTGIGNIGPGETVRKKFSVKPDIDSPSGLQQATFRISYRDESKRLEKVSESKIEILQEASLAVGDITTGDPKIGKQTDVIVELENLGPGRAERIVSTLKCENAETRRGKSFVGQLDDDESVPASFELVPRSGQVLCTLEASYSDEERESISQDFSFSATRDSNNILPIVAVIILIGVAAFYWKKRREDELEEV